MKKLLFLFMLASCSKPFEVKDPTKGEYQGTCKILRYDTEGHYIGAAYLISNKETDVNKQLQFIDSCESVGGTYLNDVDSSGMMCYTCNPPTLYK